jgi:hypothetical protein
MCSEMPPSEAASDLANRVQLRQDTAACKADGLPLLARLLRRLVEADEQAAKAVRDPKEVVA